jgi:hypothetical protein
MDGIGIAPYRGAWNKGKLVGQKAPFKLKEIWAIRIRLQLAGRRRELALFNLAIDSKLRAGDLVKLRVVPHERSACPLYEVHWLDPVGARRPICPPESRQSRTSQKGRNRRSRWRRQQAR